MGLKEKAMAIFADKISQVSEENTVDSTISNLKLLLKERPDLKHLNKELKSGELTKEEFIYTCVTHLTKEMIELREEKTNRFLQTW
ncbi:TPA: hypothetical protein ACYF1B_000702 [Klebsiella pneumoniae]|nr:hypothetical protein [Klebsiella pneumoniae]MDZ3551880.1 hypothetical protein [Klebsiella pneumoniae]HCA3680231.1 hypothetical protein [Klebsiella pneumoniae]HCM5238428.1 hypothetical protein [Klebsiella pneumoniae]HCM5601297.1 hypothetical protein [Klebsiella pneumoniae]